MRASARVIPPKEANQSAFIHSIDIKAVGAVGHHYQSVFWECEARPIALESHGPQFPQKATRVRGPARTKASKRGAPFPPQSRLFACKGGRWQSIRHLSARFVVRKDAMGFNYNCPASECEARSSHRSVVF